MKVYVITLKNGTTFNPVYLSKKQAVKAKTRMGLREAFVQCFIVCGESVTTWLAAKGYHS